MDDQLGCLLCFGAFLALAGFLWLRSELAEAKREAKRAIDLASNDVPTMARQLYAVIRQLEERVAALEARIAVGARHTPTVIDEPPVERAPMSTTHEPPPAAAAQPTWEPAQAASTFARRPADRAESTFPESTANVRVDATVPVGSFGATAPATRSADTGTADAHPTPVASPSAFAPLSAQPPAAHPPAWGGASPPGPPVPPAASGAASAPVPPPSDVDMSWEQWIGVRGAAAAGAIVLAIAAVYFFRYSMEHGLISPAMRVVIGTLTGLVCVGASELRLRHVHKPLSEYLAGAGFAILYLAFWASNSVYHLVPTPVTTLLMIAVTLASCSLAYVRSAVPVAALGLLGGFATPILLSTGQDRPIALFSYLLMLDVALVLLARKRAWIWLAFACLAGTFLYQAAWFGGRLDPPRMWLGVAIVVVFAAFFAVALPKGEGAGQWKATRGLSVALPALFAFYFGVDPKLGANFVPTAVLLVLLSAGGAFVARSDTMGWLRTATATAALVTASLHFLSVTDSWRVSLEGMATLLALGAVQTIASELERRRAVDPSSKPSALALDVVVVGALVFEVLRSASVHSASIYIHLGTTAALVLFATFESVRAARFGRMLAISALSSLIVALIHWEHGNAVGFPPESLFLGLVVLAAMLTHVAPLAGARRGREALRFADHGAGLASAFLLLHLVGLKSEVPIRTLPYFATALLLLLLACLVATRRGRGGWLVATVVAASIAHMAHQGRVTDLHGEQWPTMIGLGIAGLFTASLPLFVAGEARTHVGTWRAASLAAPSILGPMLFVHAEVFSKATRGLVPLVLALLGVYTLLLARALTPAGTDLRKSAFAWSAVASLSLVSLAIPIQLRNEWVTVGWALQGAAVIALWRRLDHAGIKYYALSLFAATFVRLVLNHEVLGYHSPSGHPIVNWIAYTYLVPVACFLISARTLGALEVQRYRSPERSVFGAERAFFGTALGLAAIVVGFVWINLTVIDAFAVGRTLEIPVERAPARDLTISLAWALYAVVLLGLGMWRGSTGLRKTSLALVLLTCLKVFLYDLGNLRDLYRVASLVGLAFALIGISLAYKRFVFRDPPESP